MKSNDRRLTAVVFTDIAGYSAIVHRDEALGARLLDLQRAVVRRNVLKHGGREVETAGDSFLLEFGSALAAVLAVVAIQQELARANESQPHGETVVLRASVHLGDVEHRGKEVYGDGVNTAARLMALSPEGGIALSAGVMSMVRQRMKLPARSIGTPALKNIEHPIEVFIVDPSGLMALKPEGGTLTRKAGLPRIPRMVVAGGVAGVVVVILALLAWRLSSQPAMALNKSVAVLPFTNMSANADHAWFADGMQDEILTHLARIRDLKVISRTSVDKYRGQKSNLRNIAAELNVASVVEGAVQRVGDRVRINVQLIDARTDAHLWAESYDRDLADVFAVQSEIARKVADSLKATLLPSEAQAIAAVPTQNQKAYDLYLQANVLALRATNAPWESIAVPARQAIALYEQVLAADPTFALAAADLAYMHLLLFWFSDNSEARLENARTATERALALQPDLGQAHYAMGLYHYWGHLDYAAARFELDRAQQSLPNDSRVVGAIAVVARRQGRFEEALIHFQRAAELDPRSATTWRELAITHQLLRRYPDAENAYTRALAVSADPVNERALVEFSRVQWTGDLAPVRAALAPLKPDLSNFGNFLFLYRLERDDAAILRMQEKIPEAWLPSPGTGPYPKVLAVAQSLRRLGETARAREAYLQAETLLRAAQQQRGQDPALTDLLAQVHLGLGRKAEAIAAARKAVDLMPVSKDALIGTFYLTMLAEIYAATGEHDKALDLLQELLVMPSFLSPAVLRLDPAWDPLRGNSRFEKLVTP